MPSHPFTSVLCCVLRSIAVYSITRAVIPTHICLFNHCGSKNFSAFFPRGEPLLPSRKSLAPLARSMILLIRSLCKDAMDGLYPKVTGPVLGLECRPQFLQNPSKTRLARRTTALVRAVFQAAAHPVSLVVCLHQLLWQPHPSSLENPMNKVALLLPIS